MKIHPVAALFPMIEGAEFDSFVEDIRVQGLLEPIKTWNGMIIDGRNRLKACEAAGVEPHYKEMKLADDYAVIGYIVSTNIQRRNLDAGQRAMIGEALRPELTAAAKVRQEAGRKEGGKEGGRGRPKLGSEKSPKLTDAGKVNHQLAAVLNVSPDTIAKAHKIATEAPELAEKVRNGELKLGAAYKTIAPSKPHRNPDITPGKEQALAQAVLDDGKSLEQAAAEFEIGSVQVAKVAVAKERGRREAAVEASIDPKTLSLTAQEKLEIAIRQEQRRLAADYERQRQEDLKRSLDETVLPHYNKLKEEAELVIKARKGIMTRAKYREISALLHPDRVDDAVLKARYTKAFIFWRELELVFCDESEIQHSAPPLPSTYAEMMKARAEVSAKRKRQRQHSGMEIRS